MARAERAALCAICSMRPGLCPFGNDGMNRNRDILVDCSGRPSRVPWRTRSLEQPVRFRPCGSPTGWVCALPGNFFTPEPSCLWQGVGIMAEQSGIRRGRGLELRLGLAVPLARLNTRLLRGLCAGMTAGVLACSLLAQPPMEEPKEPSDQPGAQPAGDETKPGAAEPKSEEAKKPAPPGKSAADLETEESVARF